jgi:hypothetical protein
MEERSGIFISQATSDATICDQIVIGLQMMGLDVWRTSPESQFGQLPDDVLLELQRRPYFLLFLTQNALHSFWVKLELKKYLELMKLDPTRKIIVVQLEESDIPVTPQPGVITIYGQHMAYERIADEIASAVGKPVFSTQTPEAIAKQRRTFSQRMLVMIVSTITTAVVLIGGTWWFFDKFWGHHVTTIEGPDTDAGTPTLIWAPYSKQGVREENFPIPLRFHHPFQSVDLTDLYRIDSSLGGFSFSANDVESGSQLDCVTNRFPIAIIFGSRHSPGNYYVGVIKCIDPESKNNSGNTSNSALTIAYSFGNGDDFCRTPKNGEKICLPKQPKVIQSVSQNEAYQTVERYYTLLMKNRLSDAYEMLASAAQQRQTQDEFLKNWRIGPVKYLPEEANISQVFSNGDGSIILSLNYHQILADGDNTWRATIIVQQEGDDLHILPLGRYFVTRVSPTPTVVPASKN